MNSPIVLIHGLWLTPRSWDGWKARFERCAPTSQSGAHY
jgi:hypothetical protein